MAKIIKAALPLPKNQLFSYVAPEGVSGENFVGRRVLVPFGKRVLTGVVVESEESEELAGLKDAIEILDEEPIFTPRLLEFTKWIADYYFCSWGEALRAALPSGMKPKSRFKIKLIEDIDEKFVEKISRRAPKRAALLRELIKGGEYSLSFLESKVSSKLNQQLKDLESEGIIKVEKIMETQSEPKTQKAVRLKDDLAENESKLKEVAKELDKTASKQSIVLASLFFAKRKGVDFYLLSEATKMFSVSPGVFKSLAEKGYLEIFDAKVDRLKPLFDGDNLSVKDEINIELTEEQKVAYEELEKAASEIRSDVFLLHGVTGSGKTLIYLRIIKRVLELGETALILVPEISLTPQLIDRFERAFPDDLAVFHSRLSEGEKFDSWTAINEGEKKIVLGARSAIFVPLKNLGVIIVDEENETSYKQDSPSPRYNARDAAVLRGKIENSIVVLGSATPSVESYYNAKEGKYKYLTIKERADNAKLPKIQIIDTIESRKKGRMKGSLSKDLIEDIEKRVINKEGVILFQNRRGFAPILECPNCGYIPECENCSVSLTYHKMAERLRCHYCGASYETSKACPKCGHSEMKILGFGTQRIEDELSEILKNDDIDATIRRMDLDAATGKGAHRKILSAFAKGETDILVGTQMVAKGLDFDRVTLVGVINADLQMFLPDFRASERTFQLLTQVAGRAGRTGEKPGEVIIQTAKPTNFIVNAAQNGDYESFYNREIKFRKQALYPPYARLVFIEFRGVDREKVASSARAFDSFLPKNIKQIISLGPVTPSIERIKKRYRRVIALKNPKEYDPSGRILRRALRKAYETYLKKASASSVMVKIDIDAYSTL